MWPTGLTSDPATGALLSSDPPSEVDLARCHRWSSSAGDTDEPAAGLCESTWFSFSRAVVEAGLRYGTAE